MQVDGEEKKEEKEDEEEEEEEIPKTKKVTKKVKRTKTEVRKVPVAVPRKMAVAVGLQGPQSVEVQRQHRQSAETAIAIDALDELLQRQYAQRIYDHLVKVPAVLKVSQEEEEEVKKYKDGFMEQIAEKRKAFQETENERKKKRQEKEQALRDQWKKEDDGLTDDEKRAEMKYRFRDTGGNMGSFFQAVWKEDSDELRELNQKMKTEVAALEKEMGKILMVPERNDKVLEAFQWFDRSSNFVTKGSGMVSRAQLEGLLMCLPAPITQRQAAKLVDEALPESMRQQRNFGFMQLSCTRRKQEIQQKEEKEEEEEKEEKDGEKAKEEEES
eukprot:TRINITY_DN13056_c0_g1_i2.p3 TRINITY_DN13056_c0_g1~~TRINITY_DN13056_c0_g1_i2.p3  ORF type:complete len:328 (+),score=206.53 TRINITY_DN13056_c0_g1_i2:1024-2007(+)